ncbi:RepB family plasmid replication initiator protein [Clostridium sardiniense]|uniref:RepB family plasmid replication initiator protein n=1 Tax=Clostridium sardiniense TaxID=29369 RepID=A0ABS7L2R7_CLOSR|nr:RepB family plasmid replication initiator protein [Clostridium sardiniense]MBY0757197.1 RepB family plasmid replication initiator protein [Clostridium sardiniense]MDQ0461626.1 plasmid replication initiation protein [Clostridium sardiniense]
MNKNNLVSKSNELIKARYNLNLQEQKLILTLASLVQPDDSEFKTYSFSVKEFMDLLNIKDKSTYKNLDKVIKSLMEKTFIIKKDYNKFIRISWLSSSEYSNGTVELEFSGKLKPYLLKLKSNYTSYKLEYALKLRSCYSLRMYENLQSNIFKKSFIINIDELKSILEADSKTYNTYGVFKQKILLKAQKELKEKTDIEFEFEEIKTGRKVTALKFYIKENKKNKNNFIEVENKIELDKFEDENIKYLYNLFEKKISKKNIEKILANAENNIEKVERIYNYSKTQNIENLVGFMLKMVKGDNFIEPVEDKKQIVFNDFIQREYDYDSLENKLLGWDKDNQDENTQIKDNFKNNDSELKINDIDQEKEEIIYSLEIDTIKSFLEEQLITIFGEVKYKTWLKYGVDKLDIGNKDEVQLYFSNLFALNMFERDYKDILLELINSIEPNLKLKSVIK